MDLFNTSAYFSSKVPVIAASNPLVKSAICALAAKHLRVLHHNKDKAEEKPEFFRGGGAPSLVNQAIWSYESENQYIQAVSDLKAAILSRTSYDDPADEEGMLAAMTILRVYEQIDASPMVCGTHLTALPLCKDGCDSVAVKFPVVIPIRAIKGPVIWSLARQDLISAFNSEDLTLFDQANVRLWGYDFLAIGESGTLLPPVSLISGNGQDDEDTEEERKSNELTRLLGGIANYLIVGDSLVPGDKALPRGQRPTIGLTEKHLSCRWDTLMNQLENWHDCLPTTFTETTRTSTSCRTNTHSLLSDPFEQIWFDVPLCAATIQNYHHAKILLLVNKPQESTGSRSAVSFRLKSYQHILDEALHHAKEICGISLADPTDPVRINSVQALFAAGQVFTGRLEQDQVLQILFHIGKDLGWATKNLVDQLRDEWGRTGEDDYVDRGGKYGDEI